MSCEGVNVILPEGVSVTVGGRTYRGECPEKFCPPKFLLIKADKEKPAEKKAVKKQSENNKDA